MGVCVQTETGREGEGGGKIKINACLCTSSFLPCYVIAPIKEQLKGGRIYFASQLQGISAHHVGGGIEDDSIMVTVYGRETDRTEADKATFHGLYPTARLHIPKVLQHLQKVLPVGDYHTWACGGHFTVEP